MPETQERSAFQLFRVSCGYTSVYWYYIEGQTSVCGLPSSHRGIPIANQCFRYFDFWKECLCTSLLWFSQEVEIRAGEDMELITESEVMQQDSGYPA